LEQSRNGHEAAALRRGEGGIVERQRALILAARPNVIVSIHVDDETDANGDPISQITIQENKNDDGASTHRLADVIEP
jgi:hypothetical protein